MVAEEKKYDTLHFEIVRKRYLGEREERNFVRIIINGQDLLERVYEVEQVYATSSDFDGKLQVQIEHRYNQETLSIA